jgi:hypothetical protein
MVVATAEATTAVVAITTIITTTAVVVGAADSPRAFSAFERSGPLASLA